MVQYLGTCDGGLADAGADRAPGAGREDAGEQRVQVCGSQTPAVALDTLHVSLHETLPQSAVIQTKLRLQQLTGKEDRDTDSRNLK